MPSYQADHRETMNSVERHEFLMGLRVKHHGGLPDREQRRFKALSKFDVEGERRREAIFERELPYHHFARVLHPSPVERLRVARAAREVRRVGWRQAQWQATVRALDTANELHWRWLWSIGNWSWEKNDLAWLLDEAHRVPAGIPLGAPTAEDRNKWHPDTDLWDIEDAAAFELEIGAGGTATLLLRDMWPEDDPRRMAAVATVSRVHTYLSLHQARRDGLPDDPYDPVHWGHDARIKALALHEPFSAGGAAIVLTPAFDPDVLEYTVDQPLAQAEVTAEFFDPLLTQRSDLTDQRNRGSTRLTLTVLAKDGTTSRVYTIRVEGT